MAFSLLSSVCSLIIIITGSIGCSVLCISIEMTFCLVFFVVFSDNNH